MMLRMVFGFSKAFSSITPTLRRQFLLIRSRIPLKHAEARMTFEIYVVKNIWLLAGRYSRGCSPTEKIPESRVPSPASTPILIHLTPQPLSTLLTTSPSFKSRSSVCRHLTLPTASISSTCDRCHQCPMILYDNTGCLSGCGIHR